MFWNKKEDASPMGVPLGQLCEILNQTNLTAKRKGDSLLVQHPNFLTQVDVVPPANRESENGPIRAVVRIRTELPKPIAGVLSSPEMMATMNAMSALGALVADPKSNTVYVGSRLTIYEQEDAWNIHLPLILFSVIGGTESILGAMRRTFAGGDESPREGESAWTEDDIDQVEGFLSRICVCTTGGVGLTAEFPLKAGAISAAAGDHDTALWQLISDQPHPEVGGGLFCLLQMPHEFPDEASLHRALAQLNRMEMEPHDLPPHFGAWCAGRRGNNPAYVSFLPNALHSAAGIAVNVSIWAANRAQWADAMLAVQGVRR